MPRKLVLYISMSLDGFIATNDDDLSWLSILEAKDEDYGYKDFMETVDTYIVGRKTYETILSLTGGVFSQSEILDCYVITRQERKDENGVTFFNRDLGNLIHDLKQRPGKNIYCDGGAQIVNLLMKSDLIDEYIISIIPIMLGDGKRLFIGETPQINIEALPGKHYESGLIQLHYKRMNTNK